jgi:hypothetical protein
MTRFALMEIRDPQSWYLLQTVFNEMFICSMGNRGDPKNDSPTNPTGRLVFTGITEKGLKYLNKYGGDFAEGAKEYREGKKK